MATIPTGGIADVKITDRRVQGRSENPFTLGVEVFDWGTQKYEVEVTTRPFKMGDPVIQQWLDFFAACNGMVDTFTMNLSAYLPGVTGASSMTLRMTSPNKEWSYPRNRVTQFTFTAREV